jgi:GTPase SAR1 family protein
MATAIDHLTRHMKPMVLALNRLNHCGVGSIADVSIPQIVLLGDQSTGKSSLVEGLAQIQVPRGAGTCTRCPLEINLLNSPGPWNAEVKLDRKWERNMSGLRVNADEAFSGWSESQVSGSLVHFCNVQNKHELEHAIRLAQLANLNPTEDPKAFLSLSPAKAEAKSAYSELQFSPNRVVVQIKGQEVPNLSFVDLPGIISQSDAGYHLVSLVKSLAKHFMRQKNTLILLVISMESDVMNSAASGLVNEVGATDRCIGVLTKPDRRDDSVTQWQEVLAGKKFQLEFGYFVTKQPATGNLNMAYDDARAEEMRFFEEAAWKSQFPNASMRQGTRALQNALSKHLFDIWTTSIPEIALKLEQKLQNIGLSLSCLPEPTKAPRYEIEKIVMEFHRRVSAEFSRSRHGGQISGPREKWKVEVEDFQDEILERLRPRFAFGWDLDEPTKKRKRTQAGGIRPTTYATVEKEHEVIDLDESNPADSGSESSVTVIQTAPSKSKSHGTASLQTLIHIEMSFRPALLKEMLERFSNPGMATRVIGNAIDFMSLHTIQGWEGPTEAMICNVSDAMEAHLVNLSKLPDLAGKWPGCGLEKEMKKLIDEFVNDRKTQLLKLSQDAFAREKQLQVVLNTLEYEATVKKEYDRLEELRFRARARAMVKNDIESLPQSRRDAARESMDEQISKKADHYRQRLGPDFFEKEVKAMAEMNAYYAYAANRYIEVVIQLVETCLLSKFGGLKVKMQEQFRYDDPDSG